MSHEIRTPLNGVLGLARLALEESFDAPRLRQYLEGIVESAGALSELITDVLDLSKIEAGKLSIQRADFDLHDLLRSIERSFRELASAKSVELHFTIDPGVPLRVTSDRVRLRQIVSNLLSNAIKFTPRGSVHLQATMTPDGLVRLAVADTGIGVEAAVLEQLFRPFVQADESTTRQYGGTGLGLFICRALAHALGGRVGAESAPGRGSTFWAELPLQVAQPLAADAEVSPPLTPEDMDLSGMRVLLVEDNPTNTLIASAMLSRWGAEVCTAQSGREALELIDHERRRFDLVLMDLHMPEMSGFDVTRALRVQHSASTLPIVALTAAAFEEDREQCRSVGMNDFVTKPVSAERLRAILVKWKPHGAWLPGRGSV
jgi:CheY-like chemotaxis protein/two-component sensor histidine kinase